MFGMSAGGGDKVLAKVSAGLSKLSTRSVGKKSVQALDKVKYSD